MTRDEIFALPVHPVADLFPWLTPGDAKALAEDIAQNGLTDPLVIHDGHLLDGRNRRQACQALNLTPRVETFTGKDPVAYIVSKNVHRRHLSPAQRAMVAAELARLPAHRPRQVEPDAETVPLPLDEAANKCARVHTSDNGAHGPTYSTTAEAAKAMDVGERSVKRARVVQDKGSDGLQAAVKSGAVSVRAAERAAKSMTREEQDEALAEGIDAFEQRARNFARAAVKVADKVAADASVPDASMPVADMDWQTRTDPALIVHALLGQLKGKATITARSLELAKGRGYQITPHADGGFTLTLGKGPL